jgi:hypothetical protein
MPRHFALVAHVSGNRIRAVDGPVSTFQPTPYCAYGPALRSEAEQTFGPSAIPRDPLWLIEKAARVFRGQ